MAKISSIKHRGYDIDIKRSKIENSDSYMYFLEGKNIKTGKKKDVNVIGRNLDNVQKWLDLHWK